VLRLVWRLLNEGRVVVADNWFTSLQLVRKLWAAGTGYVGTLKATMARGFSSDFRPRKKNEPKKKKPKRGEWHTQQAGNITATVWGDRSRVNLVSSVDNPRQAATVKRWSNEKKQRELQPAPCAAATYNQYKAGVDIANQMMTSYKVGGGTKRWWVPLAWALVNIAVHNALILFNRLHPTKWMTNRQFRLQLAQELIGDFTARLDDKAGVAEPGVRCALRCADNRSRCYIHHEIGVRKTSVYRCVTCDKCVCADTCYDVHCQRRALS
jgi:hypothetical protein